MVFDETLTLDAAAYTAVASGEATVDDPTVGVEVLRDTPVEIPEGEAKIQVFHASPDAGAVNVTVDDGAARLVDDLTFGEVESVTVDARVLELELRPDADDDTLPRLEQVDDLIPGESITVFVVGYATPEEEATSEGLGLLIAGNLTTPPTSEEDEDEEEDDDDDQHGPGDERGPGNEYGSGDEYGPGEGHGPS